jgi:ABC-type transport system involved in cytochrome c biogenesis permease subunit
MFNLEQSIAEWRRRMLAAGVNNPGVLDELESHLREDVARQTRTGASAEQAFEVAVQCVGQPAALQQEFAKAAAFNGTRLQRLKGALLRFLGVPPPPQNLLTAGARESLQLGEKEALGFHHDFVGTEHVLLGLMAVARLGGPSSVRTEFNKIKRAPVLPVLIGSWLWVGAVVVLAALLSRAVLSGRLNLLTYTHVLSVTAGYSAACLMGGFGIFYVCWSRFGALSPLRQQSLGRAVHFFSHLAAGLVIVGILSGTFVSKQYFGRYWSWDPKEIGGLCVALWLMALAARQRFGQTSDRGTMLLCLGGNILVSLAWFGAGIMVAQQRTHRYGMGSYWPLAVFLAIQLGFLLLGITPAAETNEV